MILRIMKYAKHKYNVNLIGIVFIHANTYYMHAHQVTFDGMNNDAISFMKQ
jgi:hypothetical protein